MAIVEFSQLDVSFRGTEANNIFLEPVFFDDDLRSQFRVLGNVANKKKMVFVAALENIVRKYSGCGFTPVGKTDIYERTIDVEKMKVDLEMCWDEFEDTVFVESIVTLSFKGFGMERDIGLKGCGRSSWRSRRKLWWSRSMCTISKA